jgi:hypothetical protein
MKMMLSHIVATYDVKPEKDGVVPEPAWFGHFIVPDAKASIYLRKRT